MKTAYCSTFPWKTIVTLPDGRSFSSHDMDELLLEMYQVGVSANEYEWVELIWDRKLFPVLATWKKFADGTIVSTLPNGATFTSNVEDELLTTIAQAGATGLVPGYRDTWEAVVHNHDDGSHLFTDHGRRVTFDRVYVSDQEIRAALVHAKETYGVPLRLTGDDVDFLRRMIYLADEMGISTSVNKNTPS